MGKFITFEGGEGCGKTTLIENLKKYLAENNVDFVSAREPGGLKLCEEIRNIVKYSTEPISLRAELLLFSASRAELVKNFIIPNLNSGKVVICDRFFDSTRVYQGYANGLSDDDVMSITNFATGGLVPDITFYLDLDPIVAFERKGGRDAGDRIEERSLEYHNMVRKGYKKIASAEKRFVVLDATRSREQLLSDVVN
ncbi:MAG TPA: dTMP kinase, partial [Clostridiales bacterium]|nr:dTMP kinase [Clostridiales bacterium]